MTEPGIAIVGAGDLGTTLLRQFSTEGIKFCGFVDDYKTGSIYNLPILGKLNDACAMYKDGLISGLVLAIGYRSLKDRHRIFDHFSDKEVPIKTLIHSSSYIAPQSTVQTGSIIMAGCQLDVGSLIDSNCVLNIGCIISHDTTIQSHCFIGPNVAIAGFANIGQRCFLGIRTTVIDRISLGNDCFTAGGSVITQNFPNNSKVAGVPAKTMTSRKET